MKSRYWINGSFAAALGLIVLLSAACSTVPVTGRRQINLVSSGEEMQLGLTSFDQLKKDTKISTDPAANALLQRVGQRIAAVASNDMPDAKWEFVVFDSPEANAFCLPGGKVGVYTGILTVTRDDAGMATVIGHEVAHATAHHGAERMSEAMLIQGGGKLLGTGMSASDPRWQQATLLAYGAGAKLGRELPHSRAQESEADRIGLMYMARAGYDPKEAVAFWQRFEEFNRQQGGGNAAWYAKFLSTHPVDEQRIQQLQKLLPAAEAEFAKSRSR